MADKRALKLKLLKLKLKLAEAERERLRRLEEGARTELEEPTSFLDKGAAAFRYADRLAGEMVDGVLSILPYTKSQLNKIGIGVSKEERAENPGGAIEKGFNYMGMALPFAIGLPAAGVRLAVKTSPGVIRTMIDDITKFAMESPKTFLASEAAGAFGAGAAGELAKEESPGVRLLAEVAGGVTLGGLAAVGPRSLRALREGALANLAPFTEKGGMIRAARQTQERAGGPERAQDLAARLDEIPEGVTPAQWIGDERLMAQEARLLADDPQLSNQVRNELEEVRLITQESLRDSFGKPRTRQDWEISVLEKVTPEGTVIKPGHTDGMLNQAYKSFDPLYDSAKGHQINASGLKESLIDSVNDQAIISTKNERESIAGWLKNQFTAFENKIINGEISSDALLSLRSKIRDQRRMQSKRNKVDRADLLGSAEAVVTKHLEDGLPEEVTGILRKADSQYRKYKVVENAIFSATDANLTPEQLSQAIRMGGLTSKGRFARGVDETTQELRRVAMAGRSTEEVLGDPQRAKLFIRGMDDAEKAAIQADFVDVLFNRAKSGAKDVTKGGVPFISGRALIRDISDNVAVMKALGMDKGEIKRLKTIANEIRTMEKKAPAAVDRLFEDGPATLMQLIATLAGAKSGQRLAGKGMGSSLVMAGFMSNRARIALVNLTSDEAERLMRDATTDPRLFQALLTKPLSGGNLKIRAAYLESWLLASAFDKAKGDEQ